MVQLKKENYRNKVEKKTIANARGGRNLTMEVSLNTNTVKFVVMEKKDLIFNSDNINDAIDAFNKLEEESQGKNTKVPKDKKIIIPAEQLAAKKG